jgi:hypothetical protein
VFRLRHILLYTKMIVVGEQPCVSNYESWSGTVQFCDWKAGLVLRWHKFWTLKPLVEGFVGINILKSVCPELNFQLFPTIILFNHVYRLMIDMQWNQYKDCSIVHVWLKKRTITQISMLYQTVLSWSLLCSEIMNLSHM